jgi:hypothetical protein
MTATDPISDGVTKTGGEALDLRQRSNLAEIDRQLYAAWGLGRNLILAWAPVEDGLRLLVVPHYAVAGYAGLTESPADAAGPAGAFILRLLSGSRRFTGRQMANAARLLQCEPQHIRLRHPLGDTATEFAAIESLVKRYSVSYVSNRAVALFDIVGFGLLGPFEQMSQLNSLSCSLNAAHSHLLSRQMLVDFARSSTGDGFYIWNRDTGLEANINLYHFMHLVLADNAIARQKSQARGVPVLRTSFHIGSCYEFHHAEGLNPTVFSDIVGDVTIELARMIGRALPGQILVGRFQVPAAAESSAEVASESLCSETFMQQAQRSLSQLDGLELSGDAVQSIKCYLTGEPCADGSFTIREFLIHDKHGLCRTVFNAKINIYRRDAEPILLGIEDRLLAADNTLQSDRRS